MRHMAGVLLIVVVLIFASIMPTQPLLAQDSATPVGQQLIGQCPQSIAYWSSNPQAWPQTALTLGGQTYSQFELVALLSLPTDGDASLSLARQLIAAKLNIANTTNAEAVITTIAEMDALLANYVGRLPLGIIPASPEGQRMVVGAAVLESFNLGQFGTLCENLNPNQPIPTLAPTLTPIPGIPTAPPTPPVTAQPVDDVTIVIEGPVKAINVNIITIYDINIYVLPEDPILRVLQIGDVVRIEGYLDDLPEVSDAIVIVAITIVFVDIDVIVDTDTNVVWRDNGNCANPPPPWAPANGWRRRCEGGGGNGNGNGGGRGRGGDDDDD